jgi:hypothetical protein
VKKFFGNWIVGPFFWIALYCPLVWFISHAMNQPGVNSYGDLSVLEKSIIWALAVMPWAVIFYFYQRLKR